MNKFEEKEKLMKAIEGMSREEAIDFLETRIFYVQMNDHWSSDDYLL